ncbi:MAG: hypothetical protein ACTSPW_04915, partial [Promethearchaeota archaeon]
MSIKISPKEEKEILLTINQLKKDILTMIYKAQSGHPGGSLSCVNLIYLLYRKIMNFNKEDPLW